MLKTKETGTNVWEESLKRIDHCYDLFDNVEVMFSGGKDSTILLHATEEVAESRGKLPVKVIFLDEEAIPTQTIDYVKRVREKTDRFNMDWYCLPMKHRNACSRSSPWWYCWAPEEEELWCQPKPEGAIFEWDRPDWVRPTLPNASLAVAPKKGTTVHLLGLRAQESLNRRRAVTAKEKDNYITQSFKTMAKAYPIYDLKTEDVWAMPYMMGWDYNTTYDLYQKMGIAPHAQRLAPPFGEEPLQRLHTYQICFPELWDKMCMRVPGAATAARYCKTDLYAYGTNVRPPGVTWKKMVESYVERFTGADRKTVKSNIRSAIRSHYAATDDVIPEDNRHPMSGMSWSFLAKLASRGDLKQRKLGIKVFTQAREKGGKK